MDAGASSAWLQFLPRGQPEALEAEELDPPLIHLFCFPHAGGGPQAYRRWAARLSSCVQVVVICPPGRLSRFGEPQVQSFDALVRAAADAVALSLTPSAFFGHSFGALVAFEVAVELQRRCRRGPSILFASSSRPPCATESRSALGDINDNEQLMSVAEKYGLLSAEDLELLASDSELAGVVIPPFRHDLSMAQEYQASTEKLRIPIVAVGGDADFWCPPEELNGWHHCTVPETSSYSSHGLTRIFKGGHFYLMPSSAPGEESGVQPSSSDEQLLQLVNEQLQSTIAGLHLSEMKGPPDEYGARSKATVLELLLRQCALTPDAVAIDDPAASTRLTYRETERRARLLARHLQTSCGLGLGGVVACFMPHSTDLLIANIAIFLAGGAISLLEASYTTSLIADLVTEAGAHCVITTQEWLTKLPPTSDLPCAVVSLEPLVWVDKLEREDCNGRLAEFEHVSVGLADVAYMTMTSGTTGKPKIVYNSHEGATDSFLARIQLYPYRSDLQQPSGINTAPSEREGMNVFFVWECLRPLLCGHTAVIIPDTTIYDPRALASFVRQHRIHRCMVNSSLLANLLDTPAVDLGRSLGHMSMLFLEGEVVPSALAAAWTARLPHVKLLNIYSTWECLDSAMSDLTAAPSPAVPARRNCPIGPPLPNVYLYVVDSRLRPVPTGVEGELCVARPGIAIGYSDPALTATKFIANPFQDSSDRRHCRLYRTGDLAVVLPSGELEVVGRSDGSTVKIRAFKVSLRLVEAAILDTADETGVSAACVVPQLGADTKQPEALAAYVVLGTSGLVASTDAALRLLHRKLQDRLPEYAVPQYLVPLAALPLKPGGGRKLDRSQLPDAKEHAIAIHTEDAALPLEGEAHGGRGTQLVGVLLGAFRAVLEQTALRASDNFFQVGGHSLRAARLVSDLAQHYGISLSVLDVYAFPTAAALAAHVAAVQHAKLATGGAASGPLSAVRVARPRLARGATEIAVVGMAGRFPGANSTSALWRDVLVPGATAVRRFSHAMLRSKGMPPAVLENPNWVAAGYVVEEADKFDAYFWGLSRTEAEVMDPQHRLFLETAYHAVEDAGYAPRSGTPARTGVFAACGIDGYLIHHQRGGLLLNPLDPGGIFMTEVGNEKDYIAARVAHQLDCLGPSVAVTSACSSGLAAIAQAAAALSAAQCDLAIAGASALSFPGLGYLYQQGLVHSPDGLVRPFDQAAQGTVFGDSVAAVVLKRREDAEKDGDRILAVLKGWGLSNDGRSKAGFAAPSAYGQSLCVEAAMQMANVSPESVSYVEAHATGTSVGDGIEAMGLKLAYDRLKSDGAGDGPASDGQQHARAGVTALGSIKGNIGHANAAAGLTGFVKTILMLQHRQLVATANLSSVSQHVQAALADAPLYVHCGGLQPWLAPTNPATGSPYPLRAGVSSFGIGGGNCHCILEEATPAAATAAPLAADTEGLGGVGGVHLLTVCGKTEASLIANMRALATALREAGTLSVASPCSKVAYSCHVGREPLRFRFACAFADLAEASQRLKVAADSFASGAATPGECAGDGTGGGVRVAMVFPGHGSEYRGMGRELYQAWPPFRAALRRCAALAEARLGFDLVEVMYGEESADADSPAATQAALFAVDYAMAQSLRGLGLNPLAACGHSLGEYAAAAVAGVLELEDAIELVVARATATAECAPAGKMLSVAMGEEEVRAMLADGGWEVDLAVVNSPARCVVSGSEAAVERVKGALDAKGVPCSFVAATTPFHSSLMEEAAAKLDGVAQEKQRGSTPVVPMTSNVTGNWMSDDACDPQYWGRHMRSTVRWRQNMECLLRWEPDVVVEAGPGGVLSKLVDECGSERRVRCLRSMPGGKRPAESEARVFVGLLGQLWASGHALDWGALHAHETALVGRLPLPPYAFERTSFWINPDASVYVGGGGAGDVVDEKTGEQHECFDTMSCGGASAASTESCCAGTASSKILVPIGTSGAGARAEGADCRLYCFAYAGGSSAAFKDWVADQSVAGARGVAVEVVAVETRGRRARAEEALAQTDEEDRAAVDEIAAAMATDARGKPFAMCGCSAGALLALEVLERLPAAVRARLVCFAIAGRAPLPHTEATAEESAPRMRQVDVERLIVAPPHVRASPVWTSHFLPLLQSDLEADARAQGRLAASMRASGLRPQLPGGCRVVVCCGTEDAALTPAQAAQWQQLAPGPFCVAAFAGDHSFLVDQSAAIFDRVCLELLAGLPPPPTPPASCLPSSTCDAAASPCHPAAAARDTAPVYSVEWTTIATFRSAEWNQHVVEEADAAVAAMTAGTLALFGVLADAPLPLPPHALASVAGGVGLTLVVLLSCPTPSEGAWSYDCEHDHRQAWALTALLQQLLAADSTAASRLLLLCPADVHGAQAVGVSKAAAMEAVELRCTRVFVDHAPAALPEQERASAALHGWQPLDGGAPRWVLHAAACTQRLGSELCEDDVWLRRLGRRGVRALVPRLAPISVVEQRGHGALCAGERRWTLREGEKVVVSGGTGGVGSAVVRWLVEEQGVAPADVVVLSRRSRELAAPAGTTQIAVDCSDAQAVLQCAALRALGEVGLVLHLAGVLDDGLIGGMTAARLAAVVGPKAHGASALLRVAEEEGWDLRAFVNFSSTSSLLGHPAQSNYCAANAVLDALAAWPAHRLPVLTINWGPWGEAGMAAAGSKAYEAALRANDVPLASRAALQALQGILRRFEGRAAHAPPPQFAVCDVRWSASPWAAAAAVAALAEGRAGSALADTRQGRGASGAGPLTAWREGREERGPHTRSAVDDFLRAQVPAWRPRDTLSALGLDSLDIVQMRSQFNASFKVLAPVSWFARPSATLASLAEQLTELIDVRGEGASGAEQKH